MGMLARRGHRLRSPLDTQSYMRPRTDAECRVSVARCRKEYAINDVSPLTVSAPQEILDHGHANGERAPSNSRPYRADDSASVVRQEQTRSV